MMGQKRSQTRRKSIERLVTGLARSSSKTAASIGGFFGNLTASTDVPSVEEEEKKMNCVRSQMRAALEEAPDLIQSEMDEVKSRIDSLSMTLALVIDHKKECEQNAALLKEKILENEKLLVELKRKHQLEKDGGGLTGEGEGDRPGKEMPGFEEGGVNTPTGTGDGSQSAVTDGNSCAATKDGDESVGNVAELASATSSVKDDGESEVTSSPPASSSSLNPTAAEFNVSSVGSAFMGIMGPGLQAAAAEEAAKGESKDEPQDEPKDDKDDKEEEEEGEGEGEAAEGGGEGDADGAKKKKKKKKGKKGGAGPTGSLVC